jgi:hypothetical protein
MKLNDYDGPDLTEKNEAFESNIIHDNNDTRSLVGLSQKTQVGLNSLTMFSSFKNQTIDENDTFVYDHRPYTNPYLTMFAVTMYSLVGIFSLLCNATILVVILRRRRMSSVANFFIANIVVANLLYTLCVPFHVMSLIHEKWLLIGFTCPMLPILTTLIINVNTFTMVTASVDQLVVIAR